MSKLACFDNIKNPALKAKFVKSVDDSMTDIQQRDIGTDIALQEFEKLSKSLNSLKEEIGTGEVIDLSELQIGDKLASKDNKNNIYTIENIGFNVITLKHLSTGNISTVMIDDINENYTSQITNVVTNQKQLDVLQQVINIKKNNTIFNWESDPSGIKRRVKDGVRHDISVTSNFVFINSDLKGQIKATFLGSIVDDIAKRIMNGEVIGFNDIYTNERSKESISYSKMFNDINTFNIIVKQWKSFKDYLDENQYLYVTDVTLFSKAGITGEADLILIDKDGNVQVSDFKTANNNFLKDNSTISKISGLTKEGEFATQGYFYAEMLKESGIENVKNEIMILRQMLNYDNDDKLAYNESPILSTEDVIRIDVPFSKLRPEFKDISLKEAIEISKKLVETKENFITEAKPESKTAALRKRILKGDTLDMRIYDNIQASSSEELKKEISDMKRMLGENFAVEFINEVNSDVYGNFTSSQITLYKNAIKGSGYHEGFHRFSQLYLTKDKKKSMYSGIRKSAIEFTDRSGQKVNTKNLTDMGIEEMLADEWVKYTQSPSSYQFPTTKVTGIKSFFKVLWEYLVRFFSGNPNKLFRDLYNGKYSNKIPDVNNAIFGKLNSAIIDNKGDEIIHNTRTQLYITTVNSLVAKIIDEKGYSFSTIVANTKDKNGVSVRAKLFNSVYNEMVNILMNREAKFSLPEEYSLPEFEDQASFYILNNKEDVFARTMSDSPTIKIEDLETYYQQIVELNNILYVDENENTPNYDIFIKFYVKKTNLDSIKGLDLEEYGVQNIFQNNDELSTILDESDSENEMDEMTGESDEVVNRVKTFDEAPNDKSAFMKAGAEVKDFFKTIVSEINSDGTIKPELNELGIPILLDYYSTFNKTKKFLQGSLSIEDMIDRMMSAEVQSIIPYSKSIGKKLQSYYNNSNLNNNNTDYNFRFLRRFYNVMSLSEVDNYQLTINLNAIKNPRLSLITSEVLSRNTSSKHINAWKANFKSTRFKDGKLKTRVLNQSEFNGNINTLIEESTKFLFRKNNGDIVLNPFFDYDKHITESNYKIFLDNLGIELKDEMYTNTTSRTYVNSIVGLILTNLKQYKDYALNNLISNISELYEGDVVENLQSEEFVQNNIGEIVELSFINPLDDFSRRRELGTGEDKIEIYSIIPMLEALSQENEYYEPYAGSGSFVNDGKTKYPYYNSSVMTSRVEKFNSAKNIKDYNNMFELGPWNPNKNPWMKRSFFLSEMFDADGNRITISKGKKFRGKDLSNVKTKIELVELASFRMIGDNKITNVHPRKLIGAQKDFFDIVSLFTNGLIEIPPAGTSSSMFSIKLNSYDIIRNNDRGLYQNLPIKSVNVSLNDVRFRGLIKNYFLGEVEKLMWYNKNKDINLNEEFLNLVTTKLNIFSDIEFENNFIERFIKEAEKVDKIDDVFSQNEDMLNDFYNGMNKYFMKDIEKLTSVIKNDMSLEQQLIIQSLRSVSGNTSLSKQLDIQQAVGKVEDLKENRSGAAGANDTSTRKLDSDSLTSYKNVATNFVMNRFIIKQEYNILFMGDAYLFGSSLFKRGNYTTTTGDNLNINDRINKDLNESKGETFHSISTGKNNYKNYGIIKSHLLSEVVRDSSYHKVMVKDLLQYQEQFGVVAKLSEKQLEDLHGPYKKIKSADGQGKISLDFYRTIRKVWGEWNDNEEKEYRRQLAIYKLATKNLFKIVNGERLPLTEREIDRLKEEASKKPYTTFNPQKIAFTGSQYFINKETQPFIPKFDKMSLAPIIPEMVYRSTDGDFNYDDRLPDADLLEQMSENDVDYVKHKSASKIVHSKETSIYDNLGAILSSGAKLVDDNAEYLYADGLKKQLNTDGMHSDDTFGSQQRKIIYDVKYLPEVFANKELFKYFNNLENQNIKILDNIIEFNRKSILKKFGLSDYKKDEPLSIENKEIFAAAINDIIKNNGFPDSALQYLEYNQELGKHTFNIDLLYQRKELSQVIGGEIDKQLRRIKLKGTEAIQVTSVGNAVNRFTKPSAAQIKKFGDTGLHFYHFNKNEDGTIRNISAMGVKITLQGDFMNLLELENDGKQIKVTNVDGTLDYKKSLGNLNKALKNNNFRKEHQKVLTFYGYRIPTNNNNFVDRMEIMEFLPESAGNIIITPPEQMIKSGADFDIDKMHLIFPSITKDGKYLNQPEESLDSLYKKLYNRTKNVMSYKNEQKQIKALVKDEKRDYKIVKEKRDNTLADIIEQFYVTNPNLYQTLSANEELTIDGLIDAFYDEISTNDVIVNKIANYRTLDSLLRQASKINNDKLIDTDFAEIFNKIQQHKDYLTNLLLDNYLELLSHPSYYQLLVRPSSSDIVKEVALEIAELLNDSYKESYDSAENSTYTRTRDIHKNYRSDRNALGGFSIQRIWYSLLNRSKFTLNRDWVKSYKNAEFQLKIHTPLIKLNDRDKVLTSNTLKMYGDNINGISPRDIYDQLMSATIDLPSGDFYTKLGISNNNKKVFNYLMDARHDFKTVIYFLNHPILKTLDKIFDQQKNQYSQFYYKNAMAQLSEILDMDIPLTEKGEAGTDSFMIREAPIVGYDEFGTPIKGEKKSIAGSNYHYHPGVYVDTMEELLITDDIEFKIEDLISDITDKDVIMNASSAMSISKYRKQRSLEGKKRDKQILAYFMKVHLEADEMTKMKFAYSDDRNKNTQLLILNQAMSAKSRIRGNENNNIPVSGSIFDKDSLLRIENDSIYKTFNYTDFAKKMMSLLYENLIQKGNNNLVFDRILSKSSAFGFKKEKLAERILDDYTEFIYKNYGKYEGLVYDPVTDTLSDNTKPFSKYFLQSIFNVEGDLNHSSYALKNTNFFLKYPELKSIEFASRLEPRNGLHIIDSLNSNDNYPYSNITLARGDEKTLDMDNVYYEQFQNLINFNPRFFNINKKYSAEDMTKISAYFREMAYLSLYQGGQSNNGLNNFSHLVPVNIWSDFVGQAYEEFDKMMDIDKSRITKTFGILFIENNPKSEWNVNKMSYDPSKFLIDSTKESSKNDKDIKFFNNFTAGKNYLIENITPTQNVDLNEKPC